MHRTLLVTVLSVVAMATSIMACSTPLSSYQFRQLYCGADAVFRGMMVGASSGLGRDQHGREVHGASFTFQVSQVYRGSSSSRIRVSRTWTEGVDHCPATAFPDNSHDYLVFSVGGELQPCQHSFPWSCVPGSFKNSLPIAC